MKRKKRNRRMLTLTVPAIKKFREILKEGRMENFLIDNGEKFGAGSVRVKIYLKRRPWVLTIEAKRVKKRRV